MRIKELCRIEGITTKDLADRVGTTLSNLYNIDNDRANPTLNMLKKIAEELGVGVGDLFEVREAVILIYNDTLKRFNSIKELKDFLRSIE